MSLADTAPGAASTGLTRVIRDFTPNWFTVTMGTGALALVLNLYPLRIPGLHEVSAVLWMVNIVLFTAFSALYLARWAMFPDEAVRIFRHPVMSMFFGAIPMGLATIANGFLAFGIDRIGPAAVGIATVLWWIDAAMALICGLAIPYFMFTRQDHGFERMTAVWLLPIVAAEVTAASGALLVPHLAPAAAYTVLIFSYVLWAYSVPLAMSVLVVLFLRLALHRLPGRDLGVSGWLALGPIGTGSLGLVSLGKDAPAVLAAQGLAAVGPVAQGVGILGGLMLWGYGVWWLSLAVLKTARYMTGEGLPFNLGWWGFTFPLAVYTLATLALAGATHFALFSVVGGVLATCLAIFWAIVASRTLHGALTGVLFDSPCRKSGPWSAHFESDAV
ncbi:TDT family transporter [Acidimangrovimonas sediminis]|uniref:TDT family transporter n=1 Tax=Acidimangrovimonas sediminis TaxID=2056283 RepID=UPI000C80A115|nr:TDT family transporter [Acidimangrovimonas sediminis]